MNERDEPICERVRAACAWVAERSRAVRLDPEAVEPYAATLPSTETAAPAPSAAPPGADREARAAFVICLDAINFGSGWWPTIRKRPGQSGYFTIEAGLAERFRARGPWSASELARLGATEVAAVTGQDPSHPLMADFATALNDVGRRVLADHGGRFAAVIDAARGSAVALAGLLAHWDAFADESEYEGRAVPFFKRAQITAADVDRIGLAADGPEPSGLREIDRLTAFADNLVPHVLRVDGVLQLDPALEARIEAGELLEHGSPAEVELRACAVQAVELLAATSSLTPAAVDAALWNRGRAPRYKSLPRPRSRNTAY
ncbi:MAG TPA: queuosine salvage family protein [Solirubrobacterales bacterium]|nr:queuosine salvage family protein [Solirubrobacterales bacterium]